MNSIFLTASDADDNGHDGQLMTFTFRLPDNLEGGEVFPIDIIYKEYNVSHDMFRNKDYTNDAMGAFLFTRGIYNTEYDNPYPADDKYIGGTGFDGYIAVEKAQPETVTLSRFNNCHNNSLQQQLLLLQQQLLLLHNNCNRNFCCHNNRESFRKFIL